VPIYEFVCEACGRVAEVMQKVSDPAPAACPGCGQGPLSRLVSRTSFQLKGGGWYADLYASKKDAPAPDAKPGAGAGEAKPGTGGGEAKPIAPAAPASPAASGTGGAAPAAPASSTGGGSGSGGGTSGGSSGPPAGGSSSS
jgi:putative FmdB family regulatory protein